MPKWQDFVKYASQKLVCCFQKSQTEMNLMTVFLRAKQLSRRLAAGFKTSFWPLMFPVFLIISFQYFLFPGNNVGWLKSSFKNFSADQWLIYFAFYTTRSKKTFLKYVHGLEKQHTCVQALVLLHVGRPELKVFHVFLEKALHLIQPTTQISS